MTVYFNPRFPRGKRPPFPKTPCGRPGISIHASRGGSDLAAKNYPDGVAIISIHASRGGSDAPPNSKTTETDISIHASRGGSDPHLFLAVLLVKFQSTLPAGEATRNWPPSTVSTANFNPRFPRGKRPNAILEDNGLNPISIHASRGGSDPVEPVIVSSQKEFQSTLPAGEATMA